MKQSLLLHRVISATHRVISATHRVISATHRGISATHRGISATYRVISATHRGISASHRGIRPTFFSTFLAEFRCWGCDVDSTRSGPKATVQPLLLKRTQTCSVIGTNRLKIIQHYLNSFMTGDTLLCIYFYTCCTEKTFCSRINASSLLIVVCG